ncbi:hypothetical protein H2200_005481 [Cladophialophora chaetospira]|uniref:MARVEL domain-containing protein n=1 Tax=Cladophialophora chaetospira TaxID=386627 RepID=A0AA38XC56_9EURO|nr:hypothetical protein H2200_005481 [Cladophialophora chaetospira]
MARFNLSWKDTPTSRILHLAQVFLQFLLAIIVIGLNASDIADDPTNTGISGYAIAIACLSAITAIFFAIDIFYPFPSRLWLLFVLFWQWVLTLAWVGVTAGFGKRYFENHSTKIQVAAGFNVANLLLWLLGSVFGTISMCFRRKLGGKQPDDPRGMA